MTAAEWTETLDEVREAVAARAYELFEARGGEPGRDHDDWHEAERQLQAEGIIPGGTTTDAEAAED
ncbi:MAG: DUF2934 domain-containing protein [Dehalococcoidia bacterium]